MYQSNRRDFFMPSYFHHIPKWYQVLRPQLQWRFKAGADKTLYLSFDDGPIPGVTPWVLDQLKTHQAKATFFCIGDNARKHPEVLQRVKEEGHLIGNHTFHHLKGSQASNEAYLDNIKLCEAYFEASLFRPPYGRINQKQARAVKQAGYSIVMWDVLAGDWDAEQSAESCFHALRKHVKPGSIIVLHDSIKAWPRLKTLLPKLLQYFTEQGYSFEIMKHRNTPAAE